MNSLRWVSDELCFISFYLELHLIIFANDGSKVKKRDNKSASNWPFFLYIFYLQMNTFRKLISSLGLNYYSNSCSQLASPPMFSYIFWQFTGVRMERLKGRLSWLGSYRFKRTAKYRGIVVQKKNVLKIMFHYFLMLSLWSRYHDLLLPNLFTLKIDFELWIDNRFFFNLSSLQLYRDARLT